MNRHISRPDPFTPITAPDAQIFPDPFAPASRSKTAEHEKRFQLDINSQNLLKNEENES